MRINQNIMAFNAYRNLSGTNGTLGKSLEKLSSGFRINRAADDAAGLVISQNLRAQVSGLKVATRNAQDGISVVQTAEGALNEVHNMLNRMRDLAVQAVNASNDPDARTAANNEITELKAEITRIGTSTRFGEQNLLDGSFGASPGQLSSFVSGAANFAGDEVFTVSVAGGSGAVNVALSDTAALSGQGVADYLTGAVRAALSGTGNAVDAAAASNFSFKAESVGAGTALTAENLGGAAITLADGANTPLVSDLGGGLVGVVAAATGNGDFQVGANSGETITVSAIDLTTLDMTGDVTTASNAESFIDRMDAAIKTVSDHRGTLGAVQNRFESTIANLQVTTENLAASESRIRDTDMALEMVNFTRSNILQQAGTAMLAQANQLPQSVLRLLG
jgi:flagellin